MTMPRKYSVESETVDDQVWFMVYATSLDDARDQAVYIMGQSRITGRIVVKEEED